MDLLPFPEIVTARCRLRRFVPTDLLPFVAYRSDPSVAALQSWDEFTIADGERFLRELAETPFGKPGTWTQIAVAERDTDALLGDCALHFLDSEQCEIGFTFARSNQGKGYAHEALSALLSRLFKEWQRHRVIAIVDVRNTAAIRLLQRLRFDSALN